MRIFCTCQICPLNPSSRSSEVVILKRSCIFLIGGPRAWKCENNIYEIMTCESFASDKFDPLPRLKVKCGHHTKRPVANFEFDL